MLETIQGNLRTKEEKIKMTPFTKLNNLYKAQIVNKKRKIGDGGGHEIEDKYGSQGVKSPTEDPQVTIICDFKLLNMYLFLIKYMYCPWKSREKG